MFVFRALNITTRFPQYSVEFRGVGNAPQGFEHLGHCSQIAVFKKQIEENISLSEVPNLLTKSLVSNSFLLVFYNCVWFFIIY